MNKILTSITNTVSLYKGLLCVLLVFTSISVFSQDRSWLLEGNTAISSNDFLGTTDFKPIIFKTENAERARFTETGYFGIGIDVPKHIFHVHDNRLYTPENVIEETTITTKNTNFYYAYSGIQLTNSGTGAENNNGLLIYTKNSDAGIKLQETGTLSLQSGFSKLTLFHNGNTNINNIFFIHNNNVGIGVHNPTAKLQLNHFTKTDWSYALRININRDFTKAIAVRKGNEENFLVYGNGKVYAREISVRLDNFPDYVFEDDYNLMSLSDLEVFIKNNKHLPEIPKEADVLENGLNIGEMQKLQMQKIEELTLYIINLQNQIYEIKNELGKAKAND